MVTLAKFLLVFFFSLEETPAWAFLLSQQPSLRALTWCLFTMSFLGQSRPFCSLVRSENPFLTQGLCHIDQNMTFGTHTAPKIWCSFFALVMWIAIHIYSCLDLLHYMECMVIWHGPKPHLLWTLWLLFPSKTGQITAPLQWVGPPTCQKETSFWLISWSYQFVHELGWYDHLDVRHGNIL